MPLFPFYVENRPAIALQPQLTRSINQSSSNDFYRNVPLTLPNPYEPIRDQLDTFLITPPSKLPIGQDVPYGPFGKLGISKDPDVIFIKHRLSQLPRTISLEARGVFLTTLLDRFHPTTLGAQHGLPPTYDYGRDRHLAKNIYGGNGLYQAVEEWIALAEGKFPGIAKRAPLPWLAMHMRQTFLKNPQLATSHNSIQTSLDLLYFWERHFKRPYEDDGEYIARMSEPYWNAHLQLEQLHLLPTPTPQPQSEFAAVYRR